MSDRRPGDLPGDLDAALLRIEALERFPMTESWRIPTLLNSWTAFASGAYGDPAYYKDPFGHIYMRGSVARAAFSSTDVIFTFPIGFRPAFYVPIPCVVEGSGSGLISAHIEVSPGGNIVLESWATAASGSITRLSLATVHFRAEG